MAWPDHPRKRLLHGVAGATLVAGVACFLALPAPAVHAGVSVTALLVALATLAGACPVRFASLRMQLTPTHPVVLGAVVLCGGQVACVTALAGLFGATVGSRRRPHLLRLTFNVGAVVLSTGAAALVYRALAPEATRPLTGILPGLSLATLAYFVVNSSLVAVAVGLEERRSAPRVWLQNFRWSAASYFAGMTLAAGLVAVVHELGPLGLVFAVPPVWLLVSFYRSHQQRLAEKERRIAEVEGLNTRLHATVQELQGALRHVHRLQGLIPICMHCKRIRDDQDIWHQIEVYITEHSQARFTHSLCGGCRQEHYPDVPALDEDKTAAEAVSAPTS